MLKIVPLAAIVAALLVPTALGSTKAETLKGTVGPGFTIKLARLGKKVTAVKAARYSITVADKSNIHNFRLTGPGVNREITSIGFVGTKTVIVKLKKGTYRFICDPHASIMKGSFKVL
jgi:plastocyanin